MERIRKRQLLLGLCIGTMVFAPLLAIVTSYFRFGRGTWPVTVPILFGVPYAAAFFGSLWLMVCLYGERCHDCGQAVFSRRFYNNPFVRKCMHCGYPVGQRPGFCVCGYDLEGNESGACPECGLRHD